MSGGSDFQCFQHHAYLVSLNRHLMDIPWHGNNNGLKVGKCQSTPNLGLKTMVWDAPISTKLQSSGKIDDSATLDWENLQLLFFFSPRALKVIILRIIFLLPATTTGSGDSFVSFCLEWKSRCFFRSIISLNSRSHSGQGIRSCI